jgi:HPt (histidine-containing phosphotransfer) domain-containing protein
MSALENLIDDATLSQVKSILQESFDETVDVFFKQSQIKITLLHKALSKNDIEQLKQVGHQIKSASANFGFMRLSKLCRDMEQEADKMNKTEISELLQEIETTFIETKTALSIR